MTYTIPRGSPKALQATRVGNELRLALKTRGVSLKELARSTTVGRTAIDHYQNGEILPKLATAQAIAEALDWPRIYELVRFARTRTCKLQSCKRAFTNDGGGPKVYCSDRCRIVAEKRRAVRSQSARLAHGSGSHQSVRAIRANIRGELREERERADELQAAVDEMCRACEPEGVCRDYACPLRFVSPLPLQDRRIRTPVTEAERIARVAASPITAARRSASMKARHAADPTLRQKGLAEYRAREAADPELRAARGRRVAEGIAAAKAARQEASL